MKARFILLTVMSLLVISILSIETKNYYKYRNIEVVDHNTLMLKVEYGTVTKNDIKVGAKKLVVDFVCKKHIDEKEVAECLRKIRIFNDLCAVKHIENAQMKEMNKKAVYIIVRNYAVCVEYENNSA